MKNIAAILLLSLLLLNCIEKNPSLRIRKIDINHPIYFNSIYKREACILNGIEDVCRLTENDMPSDEVMLYNLAKSMGRMIVLACMPDRYRETLLEIQRGNHSSFTEAEQHLGFEDQTYKVIGSYYLNLCNVPLACCKERQKFYSICDLVYAMADDINFNNFTNGSYPDWIGDIISTELMKEAYNDIKYNYENL